MQNNPQRTYVFVLGRPGAGKTTIVRLMIDEITRRDPSVSIRFFDDRPLILDVLRADHAFSRHLPCNHEDTDFQLTDPAVFDDALFALNRMLLQEGDKSGMFFIEFARASYLEALELFAPIIKESSIVIYVDTDFERCWQRNLERARQEGGHYVPRRDMERYYLNDDGSRLQAALGNKCVVINNCHSGLASAGEESKALVSLLLGTQTMYPAQISPLNTAETISPDTCP